MKKKNRFSCIIYICAALSFAACVNNSNKTVSDEAGGDTIVVNDTLQHISDVELVDTPIQVKEEVKTDTVRKQKQQKKEAKPIVYVPADTMMAILDTAVTVSTAGSFHRDHSVSGSKFICLTFDDGPSNNTTPKVLDVMQKYGAHCTFFCVGNCITEKTKHNLVRAESLGCEIANHTYSHPSLPKIGKQKQIEELNKTNEKIREAIGHYPVFFRPPYLAVNNSVLQGLSLVSISGSSSDDWVTSKSPSKIVEDVMKIAKDGAIIVMHDLGANQRTPVALETLVPLLQSEGFTLVTVSELFSVKGKQPQLGKNYSSIR